MPGSILLRAALVAALALAAQAQAQTGLPKGCTKCFGAKPYTRASYCLPLTCAKNDMSLPAGHYVHNATRNHTRRNRTKTPTKNPTKHYTHSPTPKTAAVADPTCTSSQSCQALAAEYGGWQATGASPLVCGESDNMNKPPKCPSTTRFRSAQAICIAIGARLCTLDELQRGEAKDAGSHCTTSRAWSSSQGSCGRSKHMTVPTNKLLPSGATTSAAKCTTDRTRAAVRCCADVVVGVPCKGAADTCSIDADNNGQMDVLEAVQEACCPGNKCTINPASGVPMTCSRACATQFLPFYSECHGKLKFGKSADAFSGFDDMCRAAWVSTGAQTGAAAAGCNTATLATKCAPKTLAGLHGTSALCTSPCAGELAKQYESCISNPGTYSAVAKLNRVHTQCNIYQCISSATTMEATVNQLCCASGKDCSMANVCDADCADTFVKWYDQCSSVLWVAGTTKATSMTKLYTMCTAAEHISPHCPQQIASAQLSVRLASSAITTHIQSIKTTRIRFDHDGEVADTQQATTDAALNAALNSQNTLINSFNGKNAAYDSAVNALAEATTDCAQPSNEATPDCADGSRVAGLKATVSSANTAKSAAMVTKTAALTATATARKALADAVAGLKAINTQKTQKLGQMDSQTAKLVNTKNAAFAALGKVQGKCTPHRIGGGGTGSH